MLFLYCNIHWHWLQEFHPLSVRNYLWDGGFLLISLHFCNVDMPGISKAGKGFIFYISINQHATNHNTTITCIILVCPYCNSLTSFLTDFIREHCFRIEWTEWLTPGKFWNYSSLEKTDIKLNTLFTRKHSVRLYSTTSRRFQGLLSVVRLDSSVQHNSLSGGWMTDGFSKKLIIVVLFVAKYS